MPFADLITLGTLQTALPDLTAGETADAPACIRAASQTIARRYPRAIAASVFQELFPVGASRKIRLKWKPLLQVELIECDFSGLITIAQTNPACTRALVTLNVTGEAESQTATGLTLTSTTAGVAATPIVLAWTSYPTVQNLADAINALGSGWTATIQTGISPGGASYASWPTAEIRPNQGGKSALKNGTDLRAFTRILNEWEIAGNSVLLYEWRAQGYSFPSSTWGVDPRNDLFRVTYQAGWNTVPDDIQRATAIIVRDLLDRTPRPGGIRSIRSEDYEVVLSAGGAFPGPAERLLSPYRDRGFA